MLKKIFLFFPSLSDKKKVALGSILFLIVLGISCILREHKEPLSRETVQKEQDSSSCGLFDSQSWMKGERELQLLEMRTRKEELENEIASFDHIEKARISFDIGPQKIFGGIQNKTKASVILEVKEGEELSRSQLLAVIYHLAAAVHGLEPSEIAISDTTGKLYKAINCNELFPEMSVEEQITEQITKLMNKIVGKGNFYVTVRVPDEKHPITVALVAALDPTNRKSVENQIRALLKGFDEDPMITMDAVTFTRTIPLPTTGSYFRSIWFYLGVILFLTVSILFFIVMSKGKNERKRVDLTKLAEQIKEQEPKSIALICSYLEPDKAEALFCALPHKVQKKVALHIKQGEA